MTATRSHVVERAGSGDYAPFIHRGKAVGELRELTPDGAESTQLSAGLWRSVPAIYDYLFEADEAFVVLEGAATVALPQTGETVELAAGDVAYFLRGTPSVWTVTEPFLKFVVNPA